MCIKMARKHVLSNSTEIYFFQEYNSVANVSHSDFAFRNYLQTTVHSHVSAWR